MAGPVEHLHGRLRIGYPDMDMATARDLLAGHVLLCLGGPLVARLGGDPLRPPIDHQQASRRHDPMAAVRRGCDERGAPAVTIAPSTPRRCLPEVRQDFGA